METVTVSAADNEPWLDDNQAGFSSQEFTPSFGLVYTSVLTNDTGTEGNPDGLPPLDHTGPPRIGIAVPLATFMTLLSLITIFGNSLVVYAVRTEKRLQTVSNYFIVSLAVSDLLIGVIVMPLSTVYFVSGDWVLGLVVCQLWLCIDYVSSTASIFNLLVLSLDRYWSIRYPLKYMRKRTGKRATIMISCAWLASSLWIIPITCWHVIFNGGVRTVPDSNCDTEFGHNRPLKVATAIGNFYIPLAALVFIYAKIFHEIRKRSKMVLGRRSRGGGTRSSTRTAPTKGTEVESTKAADDVTWTPEFDDSVSTSKDTSNETPDLTENNNSSPCCDKGVRPKRPKRINSQLRNISNLTLLTVGLHGIMDPEAVKRVAGKTDSPTESVRGSCARSPCCHGEPKMKETQFLSPKDAISRKESGSRSRNHNRVSNCTSTALELQPLRKRIYLSQQNGSKKPKLRRNSAVGNDSGVSNGDLASRKISFSAEDLPDPNKSVEIGHPPTKKRASFDCQSSSETCAGVERERQSRNGVTSRLLSPRERIEASNNPTESDEDQQRNPAGSLNPRTKFSLSRFSIRPGRATETLKRIRKMSLNKERKAAKQLGVIVGCFISCWLTYMIFFMIVGFCTDCINSNLYFGSIWLGYINSTLNPLIYPMCNSTFRKSFKKILRIQKR